MSKGMLYLVATPIGNLGDMSTRAIEILKAADLIAAEDTRNSIKLLNHFDIHTPMTAYHEFNRFDKAEELVRKLSEGQNIACISDAGTPGISDPGEVLVQKCVEAGIPVTTVPGPAACISALIVSGLSARRFRFEAFLPQGRKERAEILDEIKNDTATLIFYEAPHHLKKTLRDLHEALGNRQIAVVKELTKLHEDVLRTKLKDALRYYEENEPRGEYVLVVEGQSREALRQEEIASWETMTIPEHMAYYEEQGIDRKDAMKQVAKDRGIPKREVYRELIGEE